MCLVYIEARTQSGSLKWMIGIQVLKSALLPPSVCFNSNLESEGQLQISRANQVLEYGTTTSSLAGPAQLFYQHSLALAFS